MVRPDGGQNDNAVDVLHFDRVPAKGFASKWLAKLLRSGVKSESSSASPAVAATPAVLRDMRYWLQRTAERGVVSDLAQQTLAELHIQAERAGATGLSTYSRLREEGVAAAILQSHYLCMQYERLLVGEIEDPA